MRTSIVFVLVTAATFADQASGCPLYGNATHDLDKRWYSISGLWQNKARVKGTWPVLPSTSGISQIRYCYETEEDYNRLGPIMDAAKLIWAPALAPNSALKIVPEQGTDAESICSKDPKITSPDTLRLQYDPDSTWTQIVGYNKMLLYMAAKGQDIPPEEYHIMKFDARHSEGAAEGKTTKVDDRDRVRLAHELGMDLEERMSDAGLASLTDFEGHAMGLDHEFQRPDADKYIKFKCANLKGYKEVKAQIDAKKGNWLKGDTIEKACTDAATAKRYGFEGALQNTKGQAPSGEAGEYFYSTRFDYNSIMMYGSYDGSSGGREKDFPLGAVRMIPGYTIKHRTRKDEVFPPKPVYIGGKALPRYILSVSDGDVERIKQLYPLKGAPVLNKPGTGDWDVAMSAAGGAGPA